MFRLAAVPHDATPSPTFTTVNTARGIFIYSDSPVPFIIANKNWLQCNSGTFVKCMCRCTLPSLLFGSVTAAVKMASTGVSDDDLSDWEGPVDIDLDASPSKQVDRYSCVPCAGVYHVMVFNRQTIQRYVIYVYCLYMSHST